MNKITFTGINNLSVVHTKSVPSEKHPYNINIYSFHGYLTDDNFGSDKLRFKKALEKVGSPEDYYYTKMVEPDNFFIQVIETDFPNFKLPKLVNFALNYTAIKPNSDKILPLFSFIGQTLNKIKESFADPDIKNIAETADNLLMHEMKKYFKI